MGDFRDLRIWKKGIELTKTIYAITEKFPKHETFGLGSQIQRAMVSVPSNIAEGALRQYKKEFLQFLHLARGSLGEVITQLEVAKELEYIDEEITINIGNKLEELMKMINGTIASLRKNRDLR